MSNTIPTPIPYEQARNLIQDGDIVFMAKRSDWLSKVIDFFTSGSFSHVNMAFWAESNGIKHLLAVEIQGTTSRRIINLSDYVYYHKAEMHVVTPPKPWTEVQSYAFSKLGKIRYGYLGALWVGLHDFMFTRFGIKLIDKQHFKGQICSQFVADTYGVKPSEVSPNELYDILMKTQQVRCIVKKV